MRQKTFGYDVHIPMGRAHSTGKMRLEPLFNFPKIHNISFHHVFWKVSNCWLTKDLHLSYVIDVFLHFFRWLLPFQRKIIFLQWKIVSRTNTIPYPLHPPQTIANLALTTSLINMALKNALVGNFDNICQKGFFRTLLLMLFHDWAFVTTWLVHLDTNTTLCHVKIKST